MTFRVTESMLYTLIDRLNEGSKCRYQLGFSYGWINLELCSMQTTGIKSISNGNTKKEMYYQLQTLLSIRHEEKTNKIDYVKNCTHLDTFNIHHFEGKKQNVSHIRLSTVKNVKKYVCVCCRKNLTKAQYDKSIIPRSAQELRDLWIN